jgi:hypothetical protein
MKRTKTKKILFYKKLSNFNYGKYTLHYEYWVKDSMFVFSVYLGDFSYALIFFKNFNMGEHFSYFLVIIKLTA